MKKGISLIVLLLVPLVLFAASFESLLPLLVNLPGWKANEAEGADLSSVGSKGITAVRNYSRGDSTLDVVIMVGMQVQGVWNAGYKEGLKTEDAETSIQVQKIDGFLVTTGVDKKRSDSGGVFVLLKEVAGKPDSGAVFALSYEGLKLDEALKLARNFDWKKIKAAVEKL